MIRLEHVTQHYGVRPVLRDVSLEIPTGDVVAIVGPNGMGKSTLLKVLAGLLSPQKGWVEIDGLRRRGTPEGELAIRRRVAYLPDRPWLPKLTTAREFLLAVGRLYDVDEDRLMDHADRLLALFDLDAHGDRPITGYSNGQQKKIALASALITEAPILLLDEPFGGGLDPAGILALKRVLERLASRDDVTVLLTAPVPELLEQFAEKVLALRDGRVVAFDTPENLRKQVGGGTLADVLAKLVFPQAQEQIDDYFRVESP